MLHLKNRLAASPEMSTQNPFSLLPDELLFLIVQKIDKRQNSYHDLDIIPESQRDLKNLCLVNKRFCRIAVDVLWCAPRLKCFDVEDFQQMISKKLIKHLDLKKFEYGKGKDAVDDPSMIQKLFEMLASMESLTSLSSSTKFLLTENCLSQMPNLRSLVVTGLLSGTTIAKVLSLCILKCNNLHTLVLDKVDVFNDLFKIHELEVPQTDEEVGLLNMFSALSELKNLHELRITLSPYVCGESGRRLQSCCDTYRKRHPNVKVQIIEFHELIWDAFVASGKFAASEKRARDGIYDSGASDNDGNDDNYASESNKDDCTDCESHSEEKCLDDDL